MTPESTGSQEPIQPAATSEFSQVVAESTAAIHAAEAVPTKIKRRGRPRKDGSVASGQAPTASSVNNPSVAPQAPPNITPVLIGPLIMISSIPAHRTGIPELVLNQDEAKACAQSLNEVLTAFAPQGQMNPKTAAILGAAMNFGMVFIVKYGIYSDVQAQRIEARRKSENKIINKPDPAAPFEGEQVDATNYFKSKGQATQ